MASNENFSGLKDGEYVLRVYRGGIGRGIARENYSEMLGKGHSDSLKNISYGNIDDGGWDVGDLDCISGDAVVNRAHEICDYFSRVQFAHQVIGIEFFQDL